MTAACRIAGRPYPRPMDRLGRHGRVPEAVEHGVKRFWVFQIAGWASYWIAMMSSRVGIFPLRYMIVSKGVLAAAGFACSLVLRELYRRVLRRDPPIVALVVVAVAASYLMALVWTAIDKVTDIPISAALLDRRVRIDGIFMVFVGSVYNAFTLLAWSVLYFAIKHHDALAAAREQALAAEALASRARLETLRYQLQPHLLFNTLNGISTLVVEEKTAEASRMLARLSDFLRLILTVPPGDHVGLAAEIDLIERYLEIEQLRFGDRMAVSIEVDPDAWPALVPSLLLQPVVENAIRHGIGTRERGGALRLEARRAGGRLRMSVMDHANGAGSMEGAPGGERIGLANVRERLERLYPHDHRLVVERVDQGSRVEIEIPFRTTS